jgi:DNA-binding NtrC family response regulator
MKPVLLVVEDDLDVREAIIDSLSDLDAEIITAENGKVGCELVATKRVTAILSDINMPIMNGLEFLEEVRKAGYDTPFVVLSAFGDKANTVRALRMGAMDFLDKPFDIVVLEQTVRKALELGSHMQLLEDQLTEISADKELSAEQVTQLRDAKKRILLMRFEASQSSIKKTGS